MTFQKALIMRYPDYSTLQIFVATVSDMYDKCWLIVHLAAAPWKKSSPRRVTKKPNFSSFPFYGFPKLEEKRRA